jgi:flavorubredoxin
MKAVEIKNQIFWVGAIDWNLRNFHGYLTQRGSTYNAYLIIDEKITLVDTVKSYLREEMFARIKTIIDPAKIDYIVCNHVEMDHSGTLPYMVKEAPNAVILTSPNGKRGLEKHFAVNDWKIREVESGESVSLGKRTLTFLHAQMVHWPDSMVTYIPEEKVLLSNDAFGQHLASSERFDDAIYKGIVFEEAAKYYANIVLSYGAQVQKLLQEASKLDIEIIAPSHGIMYRTYVSEIVALYDRWSKNETREKAVIIFDTMWGSTEKMAHELRDIFEARGIEYAVMNLNYDHISDIMTRLLDAKYICVGSPTLNNEMLPTVAAFLTYMKGLAPKNRIGLAFGSFGWGGQSVKYIEDILEAANFAVPIKGLKINYVPTLEALRIFKEKVETALFNRN